MILESYKFKYSIRAKDNYFKKYIAEMKSDDEWITITLDTAWLKRLKYEQPKKRFAEDSTIQIRVVRYNYTYYDKKGKAHHVNLKYFTNLSEKEFSKVDIVALYAKRWDIECSYKTLKRIMNGKDISALIITQKYAPFLQRYCFIISIEL